MVLAPINVKKIINGSFEVLVAIIYDIIFTGILDHKIIPFFSSIKDKPNKIIMDDINHLYSSFSLKTLTTQTDTKKETI